LSEVGLADFADRVGEDFQVEVLEHRLALRLENARALAGSARAAGGFQLEFLGPTDPVLAQGLFPFEHDGARFDIFIVPIGRDTSGTRYGATFF